MKVDMSAKAVTERLKKTSELRRLCIALGGERLQKRFKAMLAPQTASRQEAGGGANMESGEVKQQK